MVNAGKNLSSPAPHETPGRLRAARVSHLQRCCAEVCNIKEQPPLGGHPVTE